MQLIRPAQEHLPSFVAALERGFHPNPRGEQGARDELDRVRKDPALYIELQDDREGRGPPIVLPNGATVPRLPGFQRWMWDGEFCGVIGFRWQPGTTDLPPHCLGHIGYAVVPWKQGRGYATQALRDVLPAVKLEGLSFVEITTDPDNVASQRVIESNGGVLVERFTKPPEYGSTQGLRFRIALR
ncbi:MAG TPA: GNAT family N-acetyltransferase [Burkholderiaceae bacterium]|jgi:predicted acetyltransferase|nr:GNAT family N-acetyltransferase [Burkholderiaceae bacterium]